MSELRLILDSEATEEAHSATIIEPAERTEIAQQLRDHVNGALMHGLALTLSDAPIDVQLFPSEMIGPPPIRVRGANGGTTVIPTVTELSDSALKARARHRADHIRNHGYLFDRAINPLLACPEEFGTERGQRLVSDLNEILAEQKIKYRFRLFLYRDVEQIKQEIGDKGYDALLAVLPEGSLAPLSPTNTHEKIKQRIDVPSQCIQHDNTLRANLCSRSVQELSAWDHKEWKRSRRKYEVSVAGLLVKQHWIPYAPAEAAFYHTQIGIDVGGRNNNCVMTCIATGFGVPGESLVYMPGEIPMDLAKAEPIPADYLYSGLLAQFEKLHAQLTQIGAPVNFSRVIFYRDGQTLKSGDGRSEREAFSRLHATFLERGWLGRNAVWTVAEVLKASGGWRMIRKHAGELQSPLVGRVLYLFEEENEALVWTTGAPYLTQGTAHPLRIRFFDVIGTAKIADVVRELIWQADCAFTKPDMAVSLPWPLYVADVGALSASRSYLLCGVTV